MKDTLNKTETANFFRLEESHTLSTRQRMMRAWGELFRAQKGLPDGSPQRLKAEHFIIYAILRGKDFRSGFAGNEDYCTLLINDLHRWSQNKFLGETLAKGCFWPFKEFLVDNILEQICKVTKPYQNLGAYNEPE